jgi:PilZ domain
MQTEPARHRSARRNCARYPVNSLAYVRLGEENGGIIVNVSQEGMAVCAAQAVAQGRIPLLLTPSAIADPIATMGRVVWKRDAEKMVGIQFVDMSESERSLISTWIANEISPPNARQAEPAPPHSNASIDGPAPSGTGTLRTGLETELQKESVTIPLPASLEPSSTRPGEQPVHTHLRQRLVVAPSPASPPQASPRAVSFVSTALLVLVAAALSFIAGLLTGLFLNHRPPTALNSNSGEPAPANSTAAANAEVNNKTTSKQPIRLGSPAKATWIFLGAVTRNGTWAADSVRTVGNAPWPMRKGDRVTIMHDVRIRDGPRPSARIVGALHAGETVSIGELSVLHARAGGNFVWARVDTASKP